jgi:hypothetical protein
MRRDHYYHTQSRWGHTQSRWGSGVANLGLRQGSYRGLGRNIRGLFGVLTNHPAASHKHRSGRSPAARCPHPLPLNFPPDAEAAPHGFY